MTKSAAQINKALTRIFEKTRIVFWFDDLSDLRKDFESVEIEGVEKVEVQNNEFGLKYRLLREQPDQKFLIFRDGPQPEPLDNWLLDVQLAHRVFSTDQATIWLTELGLPYDLKSVVQGHETFFNNERRRDQLKKRLAGELTPSPHELRRMMLAVCANCAGTDSRLDSALENLLDDLANNKTDRFDWIVKCNLDSFLWEQMERAYAYDRSAKGAKPSIRDFMVELFKTCYAMGTGGEVGLGSESLVFLKRWKDNRNHETSFETLSAECERVLSIEEDLHQRTTEELLDLDYFRLIDIKIIDELIQSVINKTITAGQCKILTRSRRNSHWHAEFAHIYEAVDYASQFNELIDSLSLQLESLKQGAQVYCESLFRIDQAYRKFIYHFQQASQPSLLGELKQQICNKYTNSFLLPLGDRWQQLVDAAGNWGITDVLPQNRFFDSYVRKYLEKNKKVYVIISDAMRFEIGEELSRLIRQENRFEAELKHMATGLPSYTQLGMASLLPNQTREIKADNTTTVLVDGQSSAGMANRDKILKSAANNRAQAVKADDVLAMNKDQCRELVRDNDVVYVYHNRIDKVGHTRDTETRVFAATEETLEELSKIVTKLTSANATNLLITADHGFIFQDDVEESDYSLADAGGSELFNTDRRFIIGRGLTAVDGVNKYASADLGLEGDLEVVVPKSINRFRKKGSATRFIHGGCTLQEVIVPVLQVRKSKFDNVRPVEVELLPSSSSVISTGQMALAFYQAEAVSDKVRPRVLEVGLWVEGDLISETVELTCDLTSDNPRDREQKIRLVLAKEADAHNGKQVLLKLREQYHDTTQFQDYKTFAYTLRRSFTSDFDL